MKAFLILEGKLFLRKIKLLHVCIAIILIIAIFFGYFVVEEIRETILIRKPILSDFSDSDRKIFEKELGIRFVNNTVITEAKYVGGIETSFILVFYFPESEIDEFYRGIAEDYYEISVGEPVTLGLITLGGIFMKNYYYKNRQFSSLTIYELDNKICVYLNYDSPSASLRKILKNKVR